MNFEQTEFIDLPRFETYDDSTVSTSSHKNATKEINAKMRLAYARLSSAAAVQPSTFTRPTRASSTSSSILSGSTTRSASSGPRRVLVPTTGSTSSLPPRASLSQKKKAVSSSGATTPISASGKGIDKISFGNYLIDHHKLKNNVLSITYRNGQKIAGIRNTKISNDMKKMFLNQKINTKKVMLNDSEKMFLNQLLHKSKANITKSKQKLIENIGMSNVLDLKDRLNILLGEKDAGNNSTAIDGEIKDIIEKLLYMGKITRKQATSFMSEL